jgi:hypothetical protein
VNTLKDLLELALADGHGPDQAGPVNPASDVSRGRRLLLRRRLVGVAGVVAVAAIVPTVAHYSGTPTRSVSRERPVVTTTPVAAGRRSIALVAFTGQQPPGYQVAELPSGWVVQGGNAFALVIGPEGDSDTSIYSFTGKLVVMLQSRDAGVPTQGVSQPVNGLPGFLDVQGDTKILTFQRADGRWVVIQAPTVLGWDGAKLAQFAADVQVLGNAQQSRG